VIDRHVALAATGFVMPASAAIPSNSVDLPVPFSPTMMVMARSNPSSKSFARNGRQNG
jgi:hypothetical protein